MLTDGKYGRIYRKNEGRCNSKNQRKYKNYYGKGV